MLSDFVFSFRVKASFKVCFLRTEYSEVVSDICEEHLAFCGIKIKVGREWTKEQLKPEGNKVIITEMRKLPRQE